MHTAVNCVSVEVLLIEFQKRSFALRSCSTKALAVLIQGTTTTTINKWTIKIGNHQWMTMCSKIRALQYEITSTVYALDVDQD